MNTSRPVPYVVSVLDTLTSHHVPYHYSILARTERRALWAGAHRHWKRSRGKFNKLAIVFILPVGARRMDGESVDLQLAAQHGGESWMYKYGDSQHRQRCPQCKQDLAYMTQQRGRSICAKCLVCGHLFVAANDISGRQAAREARRATLDQARCGLRVQKIPRRYG